MLHGTVDLIVGRLSMWAWPNPWQGSQKRKSEIWSRRIWCTVTSLKMKEAKSQKSYGHCLGVESGFWMTASQERGPQSCCCKELNYANNENDPRSRLFLRASRLELCPATPWFLPGDILHREISHTAPDFWPKGLWTNKWGLF